MEKFKGTKTVVDVCACGGRLRQFSSLAEAEAYADGAIECGMFNAEEIEVKVKRVKVKGIG